MNKTVFVTAIITIFCVALLCLFSRASEAKDMSCEALMKSIPQPMYLTSEVYRYINAIDGASCSTMSVEDFDGFVENLQLNMVSYSILEQRLLKRDYLRGEILRNYVQQYKDANAELDFNAILPLVDIYYYICGGEQNCIYGNINSLLGGLTVERSAGCIYGMNMECDSENAKKNLYFINDKTLNRLNNKELILKKRADFICNRYLACK